MADTYTITKRGAKGEPLEIHCVAHPSCTWTMKSTGPKSDLDPIFQAQWRNHMQEAKTPDVQAFGHLRRSRK